MEGSVAHDIGAKERTKDVRIKQVAPFSKMVLSDDVRKGLQQAGFVYPTVIQAAAIPVGKSGLDLLVQSKSGTGKTLIFCTILMEAYSPNIRAPQSLILVPTREIAVQIESVLNQIGQFCQGFRAISVIGGLDVKDDRKRLQGVKAVVGTPGRILHLINNNMLNTSCIKLLILDEADKLYAESFRQDLKHIHGALPTKRQTIACSATFCDGLDVQVAKIMRNPLLISTEERATLLVGIKQFVYELPEHKTSILEMNVKMDALKNIFGSLAFQQCLVFAGSQLRADSYCNRLENEGWPCELISGAQDQKTRLEMFQKFREFKTRILIATDLMSRGVDSEHVNLVINLELPTDVVTYLHRIGRAGRFGSHGIAINFVASERDRALLRRLISQVGNGMQILKFPQDGAEERNIWDFSDFSADCEHYGCFGADPVAPLASQEQDSLTDVQANKENLSNNTTHAEQSNSSIDTKTFKVDSADINAVADLLGDCPETVPPSGNKLTPDSRQGSSQLLPSSNTIDDASSIAADSLRSSQQDVSRYQSVLKKEVMKKKKEVMNTLVDFLVDKSLDETAADGIAADQKEKLNVFDDYKKTVNEHQQTESLSESLTEPPKKLNKIDFIKFKSLLIDPSNLQKASNNAAAKKDVYSDYENFDGDDHSYSINLRSGSSANIDKDTFILSVATPSRARDSMEELQNSSLNSSKVSSVSDAQSLPEVKHYTSPVQSQPIPDVVPPQKPRQAEVTQKLMIHIGAQINIAPQQSVESLVSFRNELLAPPTPSPSPPPSPSPSTPPSPPVGDENLSSDQNQSGESNSASSSNTASGQSSGFDEHVTPSTSSGIQSSEVGGEEEEEDEYDSELYNSEEDYDEMYLEDSYEETSDLDAEYYSGFSEEDDVEDGNDDSDVDDDDDDDGDGEEKEEDDGDEEEEGKEEEEEEGDDDEEENHLDENNDNLFVYNYVNNNKAAYHISAKPVEKLLEAKADGPQNSQLAKEETATSVEVPSQGGHQETACEPAEEAHRRWVRIYWEQVNFIQRHVRLNVEERAKRQQLREQLQQEQQEVQQLNLQQLQQQKPPRKQRDQQQDIQERRQEEQPQQKQRET